MKGITDLDAKIEVDHVDLEYGEFVVDLYVGQGEPTRRRMPIERVMGWKDRRLARDADWFGEGEDDG